MGEKNCKMTILGVNNVIELLLYVLYPSNCCVTSQRTSPKKKAFLISASLWLRGRDFKTETILRSKLLREHAGSQLTFIFQVLVFSLLGGSTTNFFCVTNTQYKCSAIFCLI